MEPKLISYITSKYQTKSDMMYDKSLWSEIIDPMPSRFKAARAVREVVSQVWNKEGSFTLAGTWEYVNEKAFLAFQELFHEAEAELARGSDISQIVTASRSVILEDVHL